MSSDGGEARVTIMLIDDDPDGRFFAERSLKLVFPGCEVIECDSVEEAMKRLPEIAPDAIVTDHQLGGRSGCEFISHVRNIGISCPVVMVTCNLDAEVAQAAMHAGATRVFRADGGEFAEFLKQRLASPKPNEPG